ncbi:MAG: hypothetical protein ACXVZX_09970 [Terriglobales bacterium]
MLRGVLVTAILLLASLAFAATTKRLVLKDGSYQKVDRYEIKGDRVRYYSAERYQWEEVPSSMVDWDATNKYEQDLAKQAAEAEKKPNPEAEAKTRAEEEAEARTPEVALNVRLPEKSGVFVVDNRNGKPALVELAQNKTQEVQHNTKYLLLKKVNPVVSRTETIELPHAQSTIQIHTSRPVIYIKPEVEEESGKRNKAAILESGDAYRFKMLKAERRRDTRLVATVKTDVTGDSSLAQTSVPVVAQLMPGEMWIKVEPKEDLTPGEYVLLETLTEGRLSSYVWDFGVYTGAPETPAPRKGKSKH